MADGFGLTTVFVLPALSSTVRYNGAGPLVGIVCADGQLPATSR